MDAHQVAVIVDLVDSRRISDRRVTQVAILAAFARVDDVVIHDQPLHATVGDEFQGLYPTLALALEGTLLARLALPAGIDCRFGLGLGDAVDVGPGVGGAVQDGSAWWGARKAIDEAHARENSRTPSVRSWFRSEAHSCPVLDRDTARPDRRRHDRPSPSVDVRNHGRQITGGTRERRGHHSVRRVAVVASLGRCEPYRSGGRAEKRGTVMLGALLLILIGSADLARANVSRRIRWVSLVVLVWIVVVVVAVAGLGVSIWWVAIPLALALGWLITTSAAIESRAAAGALPAVGVLVALAAFLIWDRTALTLDGVIVSWHSTVPSSVINSLPLPALGVGLGVALFAIESSNIIVRAALRPAVAESRTAVAVVAGSRWWSRPTTAAPTVVDLRGGRLIGPVERVLIVTLTLAGALPIVAGLLAAKGIVRFPEISNDGVGGSKAEYFLVGSLMSWTIAVASTGLIWIAAQG